MFETLPFYINYTRNIYNDKEVNVQFSHKCIMLSTAKPLTDIA